MTTRKQSTKSATKSDNKPAEVLVCVEKTNDGTIRNYNALSVPVVTVAELTATTSVMEHLCLNILAGNVAPEITEAHAKRGGLRRLFPKFCNPDLNALKNCLDIKPTALVAAWNKRASEVKRVRGITLQALYKAAKPASEQTDKVTLRDSLVKWCADNEKELDKKSFPSSLLSLFIDFDLLPETEEEGDAK